MRSVLGTVLMLTLGACQAEEPASGLVKVEADAPRLSAPVARRYHVEISPRQGRMAIYRLSEDNVVGLAEVTPKGYRETGRFQIADQGLPSWSHPVVSGGRLYIRNQSTLGVYDVRAR